jgi:hypothetical protein
MEKWQISAVIGTIIFLAAGFLPLISFSILGVSFSFSLIDMYGALGGAMAAGATIGFDLFLLTMILYPITIILGFASIIKPVLATIAGILGIICWIGAMLTISVYSMGMLQYGIGVYVGLLGAIILLATRFIKSAFT